MKAVVQDRYGPPEVLQLKEVEKPAVLDNGVLVLVKAAAVSTLDWQLLRLPLLARIALRAGVRKPKRSIPCVDVAGVVEAVGKSVTELISHAVGADDVAVEAVEPSGSVVTRSTRRGTPGRP
jgi:NADPH:quinone reductase-like Zn-dependent oxidoreductase